MTSRRLIGVVQFLIGITVMALVGWFVLKITPKPQLPPEWQIIRPPRYIMTLAQIEDTIWVGGRDGVAVIDRQTGQLREWLQADVSLEHVRGIATDGQLVWVGHDHGLSVYQDGIWHTLQAADGIPDTQILHVYYGRQSGLWVGTPTGLAHQQGEGWQTYTVEDGLASPAVSVVYQDSRGRIWVGDGYSPQGGLSILEHGVWKTVSTADGLAHSIINAILEAPDGSIWVGTGLGTLGGASRFDGIGWTSLYKHDGLAGERVRSLFFESNTIYWFGSEKDGLARFDGHDWQIFRPENGLAGWEVRAMLRDSDGLLWVGTENGLNRIDLEKWQEREAAIELVEQSLIMSDRIKAELICS